MFQNSCPGGGAGRGFIFLPMVLSSSPLIFCKSMRYLVASHKSNAEISLFLMKCWLLWCLVHASQRGSGHSTGLRAVLASPRPSEGHHVPLPQAH